MRQCSEGISLGLSVGRYRAAYNFLSSSGDIRSLFVAQKSVINVSYSLARSSSSARARCEFASVVLAAYIGGNSSVAVGLVGRFITDCLEGWLWLDAAKGWMVFGAKYGELPATGEEVGLVELYAEGVGPMGGENLSFLAYGAEIGAPE